MRKKGQLRVVREQNQEQDVSEGGERKNPAGSLGARAADTFGG